MGVGREGVWVGTLNGTVLHVDPRAGRVVGAPIAVGPVSPEMTVRTGAGAVFVTTDDSLLRIDPRAGRVTARVRLGKQLTGSTVTDDAVWVAQTLPATGTRAPEGRLLRLDPHSLAQVVAAPAPAFSEDVEASGQTAWPISSVEGTVGRAGGAPVRVGVEPHSGALDGKTLWVADVATDSVVRLDAGSLRFAGAPIRIARPSAVAADGRALWVTSLDGAANASLVRLDAGSGARIGRPVPLGRNVGWVGAGQGAVWIYARDEHALLEVVPSDPAPAPVRVAPVATGAQAPGVLTAAGRYRAKSPTPFSVDAGAGWVADVHPKRVSLFPASDPRAEFAVVSPETIFRPGSNPGGRDLLQTLRDNGDLRVSASRQARVGGRTGTAVSVRAVHPRLVQLCPGPCVPLIGAGSGLFAAEPGMTLRLVVISDALVVVTRAPDASPAWRDLDAALRSLQFG